ncbi:hypothetical protein LV89_04931 [Arcicella aurantiaca]|uniref:Uncharacterized protein n=1 Tax=Arcicella aurantiaca TaxID=591202 RepID=A0A316DEG8_9BACT|nr:hypothetical protein LV89_04931 [Arcicella aurantiaca]
MVDIKHSPQRFAQNHYEIRGNKLEELVAFCLPKVRKQSSEFYSKDIENNGTVYLLMQVLKTSPPAPLRWRGEHSSAFFSPLHRRGVGGEVLH